MFVTENLGLLLDEHADALVTTDDGCEIPCSTFTAAASCTVLRDLMDSTALEKRGTKLVFPVPGVPSIVVRTALNIVHGIQVPHQLEIDEVDHALAGLELLGCSPALEDRVLERVWELVKAPETPVKQHARYARRLLQSFTHRLPYLNCLVRCMPLWREFRVFVETWPDVLDADLAKFLVSYLVRFYPPAEVVSALLDKFLETAPNPQAYQVMRFLSGAGHGVYYHPAESIRALTKITETLAARRWETELVTMVRTVLEAHRRYDVAPVTASKVYGTHFMYEGSPICSALLMFDPPQRRTRSVNISPWLRVQVQASGPVFAWLQPWRMDEVSRRARAFQFRVTAVSKVGNVEDVWWVWDSVLHITYGTVLSTFSTRPRHGDLEAMYDLVRSGELASLRFDVFYGTASVLEVPLK